MLRSGNTIRLTPVEKSQFDLLAVGNFKAPTSVVELNARMSQAADTWAEIGTAEGNLLSALAEDLKTN